MTVKKQIQEYMVLLQKERKENLQREGFYLQASEKEASYFAWEGKKHEVQ